MANDENKNSKGNNPEDITHIRRCHICSGTTEMHNQAVHKCLHCGKHLAPFYYFDESQMDGLSETGLHLSIWKKSQNFNPIWGLSSYWQDSNESHTPRHSSSS